MSLVAINKSFGCYCDYCNYSLILFSFFFSFSSLVYAFYFINIYVNSRVVHKFTNHLESVNLVCVCDIRKVFCYSSNEMMKRSNISLNGETNIQHTIHWTAHNRNIWRFRRKNCVCPFKFRFYIYMHNIADLIRRCDLIDWFYMIFTDISVKRRAWYCELVKRNVHRVHTWNTKARSPIQQTQLTNQRTINWRWTDEKKKQQTYTELKTKIQ